MASPMFCKHMDVNLVQHSLWPMASLVLLLLFAVAIPGAQGFDVQKPFNDISVTGDASKQPDAISLTRDSAATKVDYSSGRAVYKDPIVLIDPVSGRALSFNTTFAFEIRTIRDPGESADGMTFFMANNDTLPPESGGGYLGLVTPAANGNSSNQVLAVEFDTFQNLRFDDPPSDHVGLDINGLNSTRSQILPLKNKTLRAWISYDGNLQQLDVWISNSSERNNGPILTYPGLRLENIISDKVYVGFSAGTGAGGQLHRVFNWSFDYSVQLLSPPPVPEISSPPAPEISSPPAPSNSNSATIKVAVPLTVVLSLVFAGIAWWSYRGRCLCCSGHSRRSKFPAGVNLVQLTRFGYKELYSATRGFSPKEILGKGGSGSVYRGILPQTGSIVAVKALTEAPLLAEAQFLAELSVISRVRHQNLVALRGWCHEKDKLLLVYEYMPNGSLDRVLFSGESLSWSQRCDIMKGVAEALAYLHEGLEHRVVHRDVKAANVLLDEKMGAKLGDFGLARLMDDGKGAQTMTKAGTIGYISPELAYTGRATERSDVYSFGILVLEIVCGRKALDHSQASDTEDRVVLLDWAWRMHEVQILSTIVDSRMSGGDDFSMEGALMFLRMGLLCCLPDADIRPTMRKCCQVMNGDGELPSLQEMRPRAVSIDLFGYSSGNSQYSATSSTSALISSGSSSKT